MAYALLGHVGRAWRPAVAAAVASGALVFPPIANAATPLIGASLTSSGPYKVVSTCTIDAGASTDAKTITWVVSATATSSATNGAIPLATGVTCTVGDTTGATWGAVSGADPGSTAVAAGTVNIPVGRVPTVASCGNALFSDNGSVSGC